MLKTKSEHVPIFAIIINGVCFGVCSIDGPGVLGLFYPQAPILSLASISPKPFGAAAVAEGLYTGRRGGCARIGVFWEDLL